MRYAEYIARMNELNRLVRQSHLRQISKIQEVSLNTDAEIHNLRQKIAEQQRLYKKRIVELQQERNRKAAEYKEQGYEERQSLMQEIGELKYEWEQQKSELRAADDSGKEV